VQICAQAGSFYMSQSTPQNFKLVVPITGYTIRKSEDGTEKYVLTGLASNTNIDLHGQRMAKSAIEAMVKSIETDPITLNNEHGSDWDDDFGEVTALWATDNYEMMMEAELDPDHYRTKTLIRALDKGKKLGLSIGGTVKDAAYEFAAELGRKILTYKDISLFHVAITGTPAVTETWVTPITKSMKDWKETPMPEHITKADEAVVEAPAVDAVVETPVDAPASTETPAEPVTQEATVETPAEEATAETPAEPAKPDAPTEEETPAPAEGETPDAPETDITTKSDAEGETPASAEATPEIDTTPAESEAPEQKDEAPASDESAPAPAEEGTSEEVEKSAILGGYASAEVAEISVRALTEDLSWAVWRAVYTYEDAEDDERTPEERKAFVAQALKEYSDIVQSVADALIDNGIAGDPKDAEKQFVAPRAEEVAKSITTMDERVTALNKALTDKDGEISEISKSLMDKTTELEQVRENLTAKEGELETTATELKSVTTELQTIKGRKAIVFDKFTGAEVGKSAVSSPSPTLNKWFNT